MARYQSHHPKPLTDPKYLPLDFVNRTIHIDDYQEAEKLGKLIPYPLGKCDFCCLKNTSIKVLWFKPEFKKESDWYGNVSFEIPFDVVLQHYGGEKSLYYVENLFIGSKIISRIILTRKGPGKLPSQVKPLVLNEPGSPISKYSDSRYYYVHQCLNVYYKQRQRHLIEFIFDGTSEDCKWLYENCSLLPKDHSQANRGNNVTCCKFNAKRNILCPYPFTKEETSKFLNLKLYYDGEDYNESDEEDCEEEENNDEGYSEEENNTLSGEGLSNQLLRPNIRINSRTVLPELTSNSQRQIDAIARSLYTPVRSASRLKNEGCQLPHSTTTPTWSASHQQNSGSPLPHSTNTPTWTASHQQNAGGQLSHSTTSPAWSPSHQHHSRYHSNSLTISRAFNDGYHHHSPSLDPQPQKETTNNKCCIL